MLAHGPLWLLVELTMTRTYRFAAGQVVLRSPGRYDSRYRTWAPSVPEEVRLSRAEGIPRSTWARRPGWHRQLVRALAVAWVCGMFALPTVATLTGLTAVAATAVRGIVRARVRRRYGPIVAPWWEYAAGKLGHDPQSDPMRWVAFPNRTWTWEPIEPLVSLTAEDSWLSRRADRFAGWLRRFVTPIAEQDWVTKARALGETEGVGQGARMLARLVGWLVRAVEASRAVRVWPHVKVNDLADDEARIQLHYPARYAGHDEDVSAISKIVCPRLPGEWEAHNRKRDLMLEFRHPTRMPGAFTVTRDELRSGNPLNPLIGRDTSGDVTIPLKTKTPHVSLAASTGWGKTTSANVIAAQLLLHGWRGVIVDPKRIGFVGAFRNASPNVEIRTTLEGQIKAIWEIREEMNRRYEFIENYVERTDELGIAPMRENPEDYFEPLFLMEDEKGSLTVAIKSWWKREGGGLKEDGTSIPGKGEPEPLVWMQEILWRGRQAAIHVITLAQQNNLNVFLNSDMRDQYMFRILSGPQTQSSWVMTFQGNKRKKVPSKKGRAVYGIGPEEPRDVQLAAITDAEARLCAEAGIAVSEAANEERAERLAQVVGVPTGAVSPRPLWVDGPAEIDSGVPGQAGRGDTPEPSASRPLAMVAQAAGESAGSGVENTDSEINEINVNALNRDSENETEDASDSSNEGSDEAAETDPDLIIGAAAAAAFLEIKEDTFNKRRRRMNGTIPGETLVGRAKAWPKVELMEWNNLYRESEKAETVNA
ncbi:helicase HerA domain-containing protein [Pseudonocardia sp. ICBG1142]|uniref:helicase HerA domain-containing protein n=1 Tax=Pseudonocardia sp. ICBG1142 TaxID=2846760 RepID=UPI001CF6F111|nr:DUF87 domain-containing protein [Pseudonocardia sp. ICBG1142]